MAEEPATAAPHTFWWDFYGPRGEGTARHFVRHMDEMLARDGVTGCTTGVETIPGNGWAAWCRAPEAAREGLRRALRPKRETSG